MGRVVIFTQHVTIHEAKLTSRGGGTLDAGLDIVTVAASSCPPLSGPQPAVSRPNTYLLSFFHTSHPMSPEMLMALPSKYNQNFTTSCHRHSCHQLAPGWLPSPPKWSLWFYSFPPRTVSSQCSSQNDLSQDSSYRSEPNLTFAKNLSFHSEKSRSLYSGLRHASPRISSVFISRTSFPTFLPILSSLLGLLLFPEHHRHI